MYLSLFWKFLLFWKMFPYFIRSRVSTWLLYKSIAVISCEWSFESVKNYRLDLAAVLHHPLTGSAFAFMIFYDGMRWSLERKKNSNGKSFAMANLSTQIKLFAVRRRFLVVLTKSLPCVYIAKWQRRGNDTSFLLFRSHHSLINPWKVIKYKLLLLPIRSLRHKKYM